MRHINRLLAALLSLFLIVAGVLLIIEVIADRIHHRPAIVHWHAFYNWAGRTEWQAGVTRFLCIVLVVVGLILLIAELKRPRVSRLRLMEEVPGIDTAWTRRGIGTAVTAAVRDVDGIRTVSTKVGRRKIAVTTTSSAADQAAADTLREPVTTAAQQRLDSLALRSVPSLTATVKPRSS